MGPYKGSLRLAETSVPKKKDHNGGEGKTMKKEKNREITSTSEVIVPEGGTIVKGLLT